MTASEYNEMDIACYHVGGYGDYSHINVIGQKYPKNTVYVAFEARDCDDDDKVRQDYLDKGIRTILVKKCVYDKVGKVKFSVNVRPESSSILEADQDAMKEHMPGPEDIPMWGSHSATDRIIELETTTVDRAIHDYDLPYPDILSIDAQGAELNIMRGGIHSLERDGLSVITEVEFYKIYKDQPLFHQQFELLYNFGYRLVDILQMQYWHPLARVGYGLLTVGEAVFLRTAKKYMQRLSAGRLIKLAAIALAYKRLSVAVDTINFAIEKYGNIVATIIEMNPCYGELLKLRDYVMGKMDKYNDNAFFFEKDPIICRNYGQVNNITNPHLP